MMRMLPVILAVALAATVDLLTVFYPPDGSATPTIDYRVFWEAARAPLGDLYAPSDNPFVNPPTALFFLKPLALVDFWAGYAAWVVLSIGLFCAASMRAFSPAAALIALVSPLVFWCARLGQMPLLLTAGILVAFCRPGFASGCAIGVIATIKPQLLLMAPVALLVRRDWLMLAGAAAGALGSILLAVVLFGPELWIDWIEALPGFHQVVIEKEVLSHAVSTAAFAQSRGLEPLPFLFLGATVAAAAVVTFARRLQGGKLAALVIAASAIAAPYALPHDLVVLAPLAASVLLSGPRPAALAAIPVFGAMWLPILLPLTALIAVAARWNTGLAGALGWRSVGQKGR